MNSSLYKYIILILGVMALSTSAIFAKIAIAPSAIIAFYRLLFSSLMLLPIVLSSKSIKKELLNLTKNQVFFGIMSGFFLAVHYVLWFESLRYTSVASSTVIVTLQPIFSVVGGYVFFKDKISKKSFLGIIIAIIGSVIIGFGDFSLGQKALIGDIMAFAAAGIITGYFLIGQHLRKRVSVIAYSIMGYLSSSVFLLIYSVIMGYDFIGYSKVTWLSFIGIALISTILGQMILNWVIKWLNATIVSVGILGESVWAIILSYIFIGERVTLQQGIGIVIILVGLGIFSFFNGKNKSKEKSCKEITAERISN